jgi:hypothetical protein
MQMKSNFQLPGYRKPFEVRVYTDGTEASITANAEGIGFCLQYQQLPCSTG